MRYFLLISSSLMMLVASSLSSAEPARSVDDFNNELEDIFRGGGDYDGFFEIVDPRGELKGGIKNLLSIIATQTNGDQLRYVEMFRRNESANGAKVVSVLLGEQNEVVIYLAFILLKREGIWGAVSVNAQSNFTKIPAVYH